MTDRDNGDPLPLGLRRRRHDVPLRPRPLSPSRPFGATMTTPATPRYQPGTTLWRASYEPRAERVLLRSLVVLDGMPDGYQGDVSVADKGTTVWVRHGLTQRDVMGKADVENYRPAFDLVDNFGAYVLEDWHTTKTRALRALVEQHLTLVRKGAEALPLLLRAADAFADHPSRPTPTPLQVGDLLWRAQTHPKAPLGFALVQWRVARVLSAGRYVLSSPGYTDRLCRDMTPGVGRFAAPTQEEALIDAHHRALEQAREAVAHADNALGRLAALVAPHSNSREAT